VYGSTLLQPTIPPAARPGLGVLALMGAIYASIRAVANNSASHVIAHAALAFYSILWWHIANAGAITSEAVIYTGAVVLVTGGMLLAWDRLRIRFGSLPLNRIGGLVRPMPMFGLCLALVVMAGVGLPPFGLVFGFLGLLLKSSSGISVGLAIVLLTWFGASWYLFKLMQRLLFGPHRADLRYDDLRPAEMAPFAVILMLLVLLSVAPQEFARSVVEAR
jgi:NADH-quinone oxidoreductase subunit M